MNTILKRIKKIFKPEMEFFDALEAFKLSKYKDKLTREQLRDEMLEEINKSINYSVRSGLFLYITTYSGFREKQVLPEIAEFFKGLNYHVDLLNSDDYQEINVLIITWQNLEK